MEAAGAYVAAVRDTIKLRGVPKDQPTNRGPKGARGRGNDLGYGNNGWYETMGYPQPSPSPKILIQKVLWRDAVHRLNVGGCARTRYKTLG